MKKISVIALGILLLVPSYTFAAFTATENFDDYDIAAAGGSLNGKNGGTGWTSAWGSGGSLVPVTSAVVGGHGTAVDLGGSMTAERNFSPISSGVFHIRFQKQSPGSMPTTVYLSDTTNTGGSVNTKRMGVYIIRDATTTQPVIGVTDGQTYNTQILGSFDTVSWNTIDIKFDSSLGNNFKVSINGGAYSSSFPTGGAITRIDQLFIENLDMTNIYLDDIGTSPVTGAGITNRLAKFVDGSIISDSLFSDDGLNTILTSGNLFLQAGSMIDAFATGTISIGSTTASSIRIGNTNATTTVVGRFVAATTTVGLLRTSSNCVSSATPAICGSAMAGSVAMPTGGSTLVVNTTAVTSGSQIFITENSWLGSRLGLTCNTTTGRSYSVNAVTPGASFTIKSSANPATNKACLSYLIVN